MFLFITIGALLFFLYPAISKRKISFVDYYLLYCLYFDVFLVFAGGQIINLMYMQYFLIFVFSVYYIFNNYFTFNSFHRKVLFVSILMLLVVFLSPILRGVSVNQATRDFAVFYASWIILPIAFHYYSYKGQIQNLLKTANAFILLWVLFVLIFTVFKIDISVGYKLGAESFGLSIFYFGNMATRGAITYIAFALLIVPLSYTYANSRIQRGSLLISIGFVFMILFTALKRFSLVVILLGIVNYLIKLKLRLKTKVNILISVLGMLIFLLFATDLQQIVVDSYLKRGAEKKFSQESIRYDMRIYEPLYVLEYILEGNFVEIVFGRKDDLYIDVESEIHGKTDRVIHNQYANYTIRYGLVGLIVYLFTLMLIYQYGFRFKDKLEKIGVSINDYWIVFQNLLLIFLASGMVGGHIHVTFRGMVLLFTGALCGYFYKLTKENNIARKRVLT